MSPAEAAVWIGLGLPTLGLLFKLIPQRGAMEKGVLKDADLVRLDDRVKLYERLATVENNQKHISSVCDGLRSDNGLLFGKLDDLKTIIIKQGENS